MNACKVGALDPSMQESHAIDGCQVDLLKGRGRLSDMIDPEGVLQAKVIQRGRDPPCATEQLDDERQL